MTTPCGPRRRYLPEKPPRPPVDDLPLDAFRKCFDRVTAVYDVVLSRDYGIDLHDLHSEVQQLAGVCCQRTVRRTLALLRRLGVVDFDSDAKLYYGVWDSRWILAAPKADPDDHQPRVWKPRSIMLAELKAVGGEVVEKNAMGNAIHVQLPIDTSFEECQKWESYGCDITFYRAKKSRLTVCDPPEDDDDDDEWVPSADEIERESEKLRAGWSDERWELVSDPVSVPEVRIA